MKMKALTKLVLVTLLLTVFITGCANNNGNNDGKTTPGVTTPATTNAPDTTTTTPEATTPEASATKAPDATTTASIVNTEEAFLKAISKDGTWIIAILNDMTINKDLLLEGEFKNGKKDDAGNDAIQRKIALYTQDENRNITNRFTLTAPKLTVTSPNGSIQHGTFKGDLYVNVKDFELIDATIDGNVYFSSDEIKSSFKMDKDSKVTGKQEVKK